MGFLFFFLRLQWWSISKLKQFYSNRPLWMIQKNYYYTHIVVISSVTRIPGKSHNLSWLALIFNNNYDLSCFQTVPTLDFYLCIICTHISEAKNLGKTIRQKVTVIIFQNQPWKFRFLFNWFIQVCYVHLNFVSNESYLQNWWSAIKISNQFTSFLNYVHCWFWFTGWGSNQILIHGNDRHHIFGN